MGTLTGKVGVVSTKDAKGGGGGRGEGLGVEVLGVVGAWVVGGLLGGVVGFGG